MSATKRRITLAAVVLALLAVGVVAAAQSDRIPAFDDDMPKGQVTYP
ncbi:MAG: hypothetical protein M3N32_10045 [Actinomycetota bacterium]|nr:hypothetical protein [Actinomycetota bacterium]